MKKLTYKQDHRQTNPKLHLLYTKWAYQHLLAIDKCIRMLSAFGNLNLLDITSAMQTERDKLITENAAYADGIEIILSVE